MELRTKLRPVGSRMSPDGEPADAWHDAKVAHALVRELGYMRKAADETPRTHERRLVLNLLDVMERRASERMAQWGAEQSAREG